GLDDRSASALEHARNRVLASQELPFEVHRDEPVEERNVERDDVGVSRVRRRIGGVVVQHVEPAERLDRRLDHAHDTRLVRDIDLGRDGVLELAGDTLRLSTVEIRDDDRCAFERHQPCGRLADAAAAAGDDCDLAVEAPHEGVTRYASNTPSTLRSEFSSARNAFTSPTSATYQFRAIWSSTVPPYETMFAP